MIKLGVICLLFFSLISTGTILADNQSQQKPLIIQEQGSFAVGGTVITHPGVFYPDKMVPSALTPDGQTLHGDHAYVFYQIPVGARKLPLVFLHGAGQSSKTWESTPDGREGFQNIFLRRGFGVYLLDQPRRGAAGRSAVSMEISAIPDDQFWYTLFRVGVWPNYYQGVQFPRDQESINQYFRQMTPNTGPYDEKIISDAVAALFAKINDGILVTHSQGGGPGWHTAIKSERVRAIVSYEPGSGFVFPEGEMPQTIESYMGNLAGVSVKLEDFLKLTKIPIIIYFGDYIPEEPSDIPGQENWRTRLQMAKLWAEAVNRHGGDATVVHLPQIGIKGNTHFPFSDLNNIEIADLLSSWLKEKGLDV